MRKIGLLFVLVLAACGSSEDGEVVADETGGGGGAGGGKAGGAGRADAGTGGKANTGGSGNTGGAGPTGGSANTGGTVKDAGPLPPDPCTAAGTCPPGTWINVTPSGMDPADLAPTANAFGPGSVVADPAHPSDLYVGGSASGLWKSTDYGNTWKAMSKDIPNAPRGVTIAVAGTTPATVWGSGYRDIFKLTDGGATFTKSPMTVELYSIKVDPNDPDHLISGLHEADGVYESTDGGTTWDPKNGGGFPSGGKSWYPDFINTGSAATTRTTWFAIAQDGGSACMTSDGGASWHIPTGLNGLNHPHGNAQMFQNGNTLFAAGVGGPGQGVYRSTDLGGTWSRVDSGDKPEALVWGTTKNVYAMYAWACSNCDLGTNFEIAPQPGTAWTYTNVPTALKLGPNSVAVTSDGTHNIFVAVMWSLGVWRYVEP